MQRWPVFLAMALALGGCGLVPAGFDTGADASVANRIERLMPTDALLLGEQHDAAEHQQFERDAVQALAAKGRLAALALEMAESGNDTSHLAADATEAQVRTALSWNDQAWPWSAYGPVVMAAVRAGVPVLGANLPRASMKDAMADVSLDVQLSAAAMATQQDAIRTGHCNLLPEAQILPMTRIQIARDRSMAHTVATARVAGKTVLLVAGAGHVEPALGVPQQLPDDVKVKTVRLAAGADAASGTPGKAPGAAFDAVWPSPPVPEKDHCAALRSPKRS